MADSRKSNIYFFFEKGTKLEKRASLKKFIQGIFKREGRELKSLNIIFCSDDYLRSINRDYLKHDYYTDIVTFELSDGKDPIEGEIYVSVDRVIENASTFGVPRVKELHRVIIHGVLHLCGYKDKTTANKNQMTALEDHYLSSLKCFT